MSSYHPTYSVHILNEGNKFYLKTALTQKAAQFSVHM